MTKKLKQQKNLNNFEIEDFQFIGNHVLLKAIKITETKEGLKKPKQQDDKPEFGEVLSVGALVDSIYNIKKGDIVLFGRYTSEEINHNGKTFYFTRDEDIKGVLNA